MNFVERNHLTKIFIMKKMLFSCLLFLSFFGNVMGQADAISEYFDKYLEDERFTVVYISGKMFSMFSKLDTVRTKKGNRVEFVVKEDGDKIDELLLISGGRDHDFVLMSFVGDIDLDEISKLSDSIDIDGMDGLEDLKELKKRN